MMTALEQFGWGRPSEGYVWEDTTVAKMPGAKLEPRDAAETRFLRWIESSSSAVLVTPLQENAALFREFAYLQPTENAFLEFANQHGWLGVSRFLRGEPSEDGKTISISLGDPRAQGEPLWRWKEARREMWRVATVVEAILNRDISTLRQWFQISEHAVRYLREEPDNLPGYPSMEWICSGEPPLRSWLWQWGNQGRDDDERLIRFASGWAQKQINDAMGGSEKETATSVRILMNDEKDGMTLHIVPDTLLAAMWLQCARALTENPTFKACEHCGKWFELAPGARRKNSKYCSVRCKVAAHRALIPLTCEHCGTKFRAAITGTARI